LLFAILLSCPPGLDFQWQDFFLGCRDSKNDKATLGRGKVHRSLASGGRTYQAMRFGY
jgi:hypothetical protein